MTRNNAIKICFRTLWAPHGIVGVLSAGYLGQSPNLGRAIRRGRSVDALWLHTENAFSFRDRTLIPKIRSIRNDESAVKMRSNSFRPFFCLWISIECSITPPGLRILNMSL